MRINSLIGAVTATILGVALVSVGSSKNANAFIDLNLTGTSLVGSNTAYTYSVTLSGGFNLDNTSRVTMFDFLGLQSVTAFSSDPGAAALGFTGFTITTPFTGPGVPIFGTDSAATQNIVLTSNGAFTGPTGTTGQILGTFTATSLFPQANGTPNEFRSDDRNQTNNTPSAAGSFTQGPGQVVVPEAGTMALLSTGLLGFVGVGLRRRATK